MTLRANSKEIKLLEVCVSENSSLINLVNNSLLSAASNVLNTQMLTFNILITFAFLVTFMA